MRLLERGNIMGLFDKLKNIVTKKEDIEEKENLKEYLCISD